MQRWLSQGRHHVVFPVAQVLGIYGMVDAIRGPNAATTKIFINIY